MSPELRAALEKLLESKTFGVFFAPEARTEALLAATALTYGASLAGKNVAASDLPQNFSKKWSALLPALPAATARPVTITLPKKIGIKEMSYDERGESLELTIHTNERPDLAAIKIAEASLQLNAVFCFANDEAVLDKLGANYILPVKNQIVLIAAGDRLVTEKISDLLRLLGEKVWKNSTVATLLFAALVSETDNFQKDISKSALALAAELLDCGANKEKIRAVRESAAALNPENKILGRALTRTYQDTATRAAWTFLLPQDFAKTATAPTPEFFGLLAGAMRKVIAAPTTHIFLWKETSGLVHSLAFASEPNALTALAQKFDTDAAAHGAAFIKLPSFQNFSAAEKGLRELLKTVA
ncbi:MAG: hypothetical protein HZA25_00770 [Candidatus Niyogibacteria bacterium]|nr:hypothetical protein [Candidatus Niyogibacteria bacterium]